MKYRELEWILVDEIPMVSNDLWKYVHFCLQETKQCKEPFEGVNIIAIGDMYQLQPMKANYVFMDFGTTMVPWQQTCGVNTSQCMNLMKLCSRNMTGSLLNY